MHHIYKHLVSSRALASVFDQILNIAERVIPRLIGLFHIVCVLKSVDTDYIVDSDLNALHGIRPQDLADQGADTIGS